MGRRLHYRAQKVVVGDDEVEGARTPPFLNSVVAALCLLIKGSRRRFDVTGS